MKRSIPVFLALALAACTVESPPQPTYSTTGGSAGIPALSAGAAGLGSAGAGGAAGAPDAGMGGAAGQVVGGAAGVSGASAAGAGGATPACSELDPRQVPAEVSVLPDAGEAPFVNALQAAQSSIDVMVYQMGYGGVLDNIQAKAKSGVKVRVILDLAQKKVNQKYMDALVAAGAQVEWSDPGFTYMHAKLILVDDKVAVISTGNYLKSYMLKERNFVVTNRDPWDVANLVSLFQADWQRLSPMLDCTRLLVSPINARARILSLINGASSTLTIESMQFADSAVRDAVAARKAAGVDVRVLLASPSWIDANQAAATFLSSHGIEARYLTSPSVHVKAIVADGARAYAGSENLSYTSLSKNREVGVVMTDSAAVSAVVSTFDKDWAKATPF
ncbi:MAG: phospholipase D-like domain-containing protein [Polyangiaceae bacterium]